MVVVQGAISHPANSAEGLMELFEMGSKNRHVSATSKNQTCIFAINSCVEIVQPHVILTRTLKEVHYSGSSYESYTECLLLCTSCLIACLTNSFFFVLWTLPEMNAESSRSHLVIGVIIESTNLTNGSVHKGKVGWSSVRAIIILWMWLS